MILLLFYICSEHSAFSPQGLYVVLLFLMKHCKK